MHPDVLAVLASAMWTRLDGLRNARRAMQNVPGAWESVCDDHRHRDIPAVDELAQHAITPHHVRLIAKLRADYEETLRA